jgi:hypothetical protein
LGGRELHGLDGLDGLDESGCSPTPFVTECGFRALFLFSFFGRMVSELGFVRRLPLTPVPVPPPTATWGIELTVSVSTVMLFVAEASTPFFPARAEVALVRGVEFAPVDVGLSLISPFFSPLSLPLSVVPAAADDFMFFEKACSIACCSSGSPLSFHSRELSNPTPGLPGWLDSGTVSSVVALVLTPRPGLRMPDIADGSSLSVSVFVDCVLSFDDWNRSVLIGGCSWSVFRAMPVGLLIGGGDLRRGDIGHRGVSLNSVGTVIFCGCGATMAVSDVEGLRRGVFVADSALCTAALDGTFGIAALADRDGLGS